MATASRNIAKELEAAVDGCPELRGAGIVVIGRKGQTEIRGGPRVKWVYITPKLYSSAKQTVSKDPAPASKGSLATFWDRYGGAILQTAPSCVSAGASGAVIFLSGGVATPVVGFFALNSAALCGMSIGKAIQGDAWTEFEKNGGAAYRAFLTTETLMSLLDLANGAAGAVTLMRQIERAGKLAKLQKAVNGQKIANRTKLRNLIREVDSKFEGNMNGPGYVSKKQLVVGGQELLRSTKINFISLSNQHKRLLVESIGNAFTIGDAGSTMDNVFDLYLVIYE